MKRLLTIISLILAFRACCSAGPNPSELKSFKVLVPDYSKTSGGVCPAISEDGSLLSFSSYPSGLDTYILPLNPADKKAASTPKKIEYQYGKDVLRHDVSMSRDNDWSHQGNRLAFVGRDGGLYVMQPNDQPRLLVPPTTIEYGMIESPRWSPDDSHIAYIIQIGPGGSHICVVDAATGKQKILADDGLMIMSHLSWQQPWSPDSKRLVYAASSNPANIFSDAVQTFFSEQPITKDSNRDPVVHPYLAIIGIDGESKGYISRDGPCLAPAWSPVEDKIAFASATSNVYNISDKMHVRYSTLAIFTCDSGGMNLKQVTTHGGFPSKSEVRETWLANYDAAVKAFEKKYGPRLSPEQTNDLNSRKLTLGEMISIAVSIDSSDKKNIPEKISSAASFMDEVFPRGVNRRTDKLKLMDMSPVWSEDGKQLAFVRGALDDEFDYQLLIHDLSGGKETVLADHAGIASVSWTNGGKQLVAQLIRPMSWQRDDADTRSRPGYPEIWLLEPK